MTPPFNRIALTLFSVLVLVIAGCRSGAELSPAPRANEAPGEDAAISTVDNVEVRAQPGEWPGDVAVRREVTPIQVTIDNNSNRPVRLRYDQFALVSLQGRRYSAIPPYTVEGDVSEPVVTSDYAVINEPLFTYDAFDVAPYYSDIYPTLGVYDPFYYDPYYYDAYETYYAEVDLPTPEMLQRALPEGAIRPGGSVTGFLYFEDVSDAVPRVQFRGQLVDASNGTMFGEVTIPFNVQDS